MPTTNLNHQTIGELNHGFAGDAIDAEIDKAYADLSDRGEEDGKTRTVTITLSLMKLKGGAIGVDVQAVAKIPTYRTGVTICEEAIQGRKKTLVFRADNPDNPKQQTLADGEVDE